MTRATTALALWAAACGCGSRGVAPAHTSLGGQVVARVGSVDLPVGLVAAVAAAEHVTPGVALGRLVEDALAANGAVASALDRAPAVSFATTTALSRATLRRIEAEAHATLPSDDEVRRLSAIHWIVVDAPATSITIHAAVLRPDPPNPALEAPARSVAAAIAAAVASTVTSAEFEAAANAVPHPGSLKVVVETLPPLTADGRAAVAGADGRFDLDFSKAAAALPSPGATSGVVETSFGWHVIRLLERSAPRLVPFEERRKIFAPETYLHRTQDSIEALENARRTSEGVSQAHGVDEILALATVHLGAKPAAPSPGP